MLYEQRLNGRGKLHVQIKEVHRKGQGEETGQKAQKAQKNFAYLIHVFSFRLPGFFIRQDLKAGVKGLLAHHGAHVAVDLLAHALTGDDPGVEEVMGNPDKMDTVSPGLFLKLAVHTVQRFAAHVLPENDHVGVELLAELPQLVQQDLVSQGLRRVATV